MSEINNFSVLHDYFDNDAMLNVFSKEEKEVLRSERKEIIFKKGDLILEEGKIPTGIFLIKEGTAKVYKVGFTGKEQIIRFLKSGDMIGYRSLLTGEAFGSSASAISAVKVEFFPGEFFLKMLQENSSFSFEMLKLISKQLGDAAETITTLAQKTVRERLAEVLMMLEEQLGNDNENYINISLTREEMGNLIGTATESAIRLISEFKNDGLIAVQGRRIKIVNREMIKKLAHVG
ncbi:Crp/Fnr family transcriptional regulator [Ornithobacterium rhinotracheale]|uniref:cAMP-binding protein n=1 Tax=Ornithobacterium rhinotracheale (strain ATCC 51463 / DSM 15997 / CCUG 23171 / CIP 104009 / LMG 9086) TaxID=867902 RepID=I3ZZ64_ORNRL|nr:Crp/Fnr family transcriptional regulator [Ornithobacterium rhinotracheale]AFL96998.1 cAMP-binding protein [Ornithobacterium rhinotracheale DSM 15997]